MFYCPRKWDLSTGARMGALRARCVVHTHAQNRQTSGGEKRSAAECWVELMTPSPGLKYTVSRQRRRKRGQQIKSCGVACSLCLTPLALLSVCYMNELGCTFDSVTSSMSNYFEFVGRNLVFRVIVWPLLNAASPENEKSWAKQLSARSAL